MYLILFIGIAILSYVVQSNLNSKFKKYSKIPIASGLSGREVAEKMLRDNGINNVTVTCTKVTSPTTTTPPMALSTCPRLCTTAVLLPQPR